MGTRGREIIGMNVEHLIDLLNQAYASEWLAYYQYPEDYRFLGLPLIPDLKPGRGALGGLYTAITSATHPLVAVVACDMPFASPKLLEAASRLMIQEEADVVIAKTDEGYEPIHAVYRRATCLPAIDAAIVAEQWKVIAWFPKVKVRVLTSDELQQFDPDGLAFWNVNTPDEFLQAEQVAQSKS